MSTTFDMATLLKWGGVLALLGALGTQIYTISATPDPAAKRAAIATAIMVGVALLAFLYFTLTAGGGKFTTMPLGL